MFRWAGTFPFQWGTAAAAVITTAAPQWAWAHNVHPHRVFPMSVTIHHVQPGRQYNIDPTLETFLFEDA